MDWANRPQLISVTTAVTGWVHNRFQCNLAVWPFAVTVHSARNGFPSSSWSAHPVHMIILSVSVHICNQQSWSLLSLTSRLEHLVVGSLERVSISFEVICARWPHALCFSIFLISHHFVSLVWFYQEHFPLRYSAKCVHVNCTIGFTSWNLRSARFIFRGLHSSNRSAWAPSATNALALSQLFATSRTLSQISLVFELISLKLLILQFISIRHCHHHIPNFIKYQYTHAERMCANVTGKQKQLLPITINLLTVYICLRFKKPVSFPVVYALANWAIYLHNLPNWTSD